MIPAPGGAERRRAGQEHGFTLIEIVVSALIVVLIATAVGQALISGGHMSGYQLARSQADQLAQQDQERLRGLSAKQLEGLSTVQTNYATVGGTKYTVTSQATLLSTGGTNSCTTSGTSAVAYFHTVSTVAWSDTNGSHSLNEDSLITPPAGGALLAQVQDQTGSALSGISVTATGQSTGGDSEGATTDASGCVIFTGLATDTYNLSFSGVSGTYVDKDGNTPVTDTATVSESGTANPTGNPEVMGLAGLVTANFATQAYTSNTGTTVGTVAGQYADGLSWYGAGNTRSMSAFKDVTASGTGASSLSTSALFPFAFTGPPVSYASNYHVWAGRCLGEEAPSGYDTVSVSPGSTPTATVAEPALNLVVEYNGSRVAPSDVHITWNNTSGTSCSDDWAETISGAASSSTNGVLAYPGVPYASTTTSGATASASGVSGTLTACADYYVSAGRSGTYYETSSAPTGVTNMTAPTALTLNITTGRRGTATTGQCT